MRRADRFTQLALAAPKEALEDAGWEDGPPGDPDRAACVIGTGIGGIGTLERQHVMLQEQGADSISPLSIPLLMANAASGVVAMKHDLRGQSFGTVSACAAGAHAIGMAERLIRYGDADDRRRRRQRGGDHAARHRGLHAHGRALGRAASRAPSTAVATAS